MRREHLERRTSHWQAHHRHLRGNEANDLTLINGQLLESGEGEGNVLHSQVGSLDQDGQGGIGFENCLRR